MKRLSVFIKFAFSAPLIYLFGVILNNSIYIDTLHADIPGHTTGTCPKVPPTCGIVGDPWSGSGGGDASGSCDSGGCGSSGGNSGCGSGTCGENSGNSGC